MKNLKKVLAMLTAVALLVSCLAMALAEDLGETAQVEIPVVEETPVGAPAEEPLPWKRLLPWKKLP